MSTMGAPHDLKQLHEPLRHLSTHAQKKREEVERLRRELADAEKELERFDTDYTKTLTYYARTDCLQLATMMYEKLPQELREMVYEYLCVDPDRPIPVGPYYHFRPYDRPYVYQPPINSDAEPDESMDWLVGAENQRVNPMELVHEPDGTLTGWDHTAQVDPDLVKRISSLCIQQDMNNMELDNNFTILPDGRVKEEHSHKPPSDMVLPSTHFLDPRFVGPEVSYETQKMYYSRNTFSVCTVEKALTRFLGWDTGYSMLKWVDGFAPPLSAPNMAPLPPFFAAEHIRKLQVRVKVEHYLLDKPEREFFLDRYFYDQRFLLRTCNYLKGLNYYLDQRPKGAVEIEFVVMSQLPDLIKMIRHPDYDEAKLDRDRCYINFLECTRDMVYKVMYDYEDVLVKVTHYDPNVAVFPRDITGLFALTKEQWEYEKTKRLGVPYCDAQFFVMQGNRHLRDNRDLPGLNDEDLDDIVAERWGMRHAMSRAAVPPTEGRFWPLAVREDD